MKNLNSLLVSLALSFLFVTACEKEDPNPEPVAAFTVSNTTVEMNEIIAFTNTSEHANSYSWDFGDGDTSTEENPEHSYASEGTFSVNLTAKGEGGESTFSKSITITAPANPLLGTWNITGGTFNGSSISDLSGYRKFGNEEVAGANWTGNSTCNMSQGSDRGTVYGAYEIAGNTLIYGYNMTSIYWVDNTSNFEKFGVVGLGLQTVNFSISGKVLTISGENSKGTTVLTYEK